MAASARTRKFPPHTSSQRHRAHRPFTCFFFSLIFPRSGWVPSVQTAEKGFSRYPVYDGEKNKIVGILNIYDCYNVEKGRIDLSGMVRSAGFFETDTHVTEALRRLRETRQPIGIVMSEGAAVGIVTVKDCVEEIVGELYEW